MSRKEQQDQGNNTSIQFRVGELFAARIDAAAKKESMSRNAWLELACREYLTDPANAPVSITAEELLAYKKTINIRTTAETVQEINTFLEANKHYARTIWCIDACMKRMRKIEF